jgi:S-formylglutathione hydrolase
MKRVALVLVGFVTCVPVAFGSSIVYRTFYSPHLGETKALNVYLPDGYDPLGTERYPVIYFLHGWTQGYASNWPVLRPVLDSMIGQGQIHPCLVVAPDGRCDPYLGSWWADSALYGDYEDYVASDVVDFVESSYPTQSLPERRALMGWSMGGGGAMAVGLRHTDRFRAVAAHSGFFNYDRMRGAWRDTLLSYYPEGAPYDFQWDHDWQTNSMFGASGAYSPNLENPPTYVDLPFDAQGSVVEAVLDRWKANDPDVLAAMLSPDDYPAIWFDCGDQEWDMYPSNLDLAAAFDSMGVPYVFHPFPGGHDLTAERLQPALAFLDAAMFPVSSVGRSEDPSPGELRLELRATSPIRETGVIRFREPAGGRVVLRILDVNGRRVETLFDGQGTGGLRSVTWTPRDRASGVYLLQLSSAGCRLSRGLVRLR